MKNAVILYLTCKKDLWVFNSSLKLLYNNFNKKYNYPVVIFHDDLTNIDISLILKSIIEFIGYMPNIKFEKIVFSLPSHISSDPTKYDPPLSKHRLGYRFMCNFFAGEVYNHPAIKKYDWYLRLDSDSFILSYIDFDPFEYMDLNNMQYGYMAEYDIDSEETTKGFFESTMKYFTENNISIQNLLPKLKNNKWDMQVFYSNFVIAKLDFFRNEKFQNYYNYLNNLGGIFYNRWGDHDIQWFAVNTFLTNNEIWCVKNICYQHGSWVKNLDFLDKSSINLIPEVYKKWINQ
jgi:hypothetical protein